MFCSTHSHFWGATCSMPVPDQLTASQDATLGPIKTATSGVENCDTFDAPDCMYCTHKCKNRQYVFEHFF